MKTDIDKLFQIEKQASEARRKKQKTIFRVVGVFIFFMFLVGFTVAFFVLQKGLSGHQFHAIILQGLGFGAISGIIEYIKIRIKGKQRSYIFEAIQLLVFLVYFLVIAQL